MKDAVSAILVGFVDAFLSDFDHSRLLLGGVTLEQTLIKIFRFFVSS